MDFVVSFQCEAVLRSLLLESKREDVKKSDAMLSPSSIQSQHSSAFSGCPSSPSVTCVYVTVFNSLKIRFCAGVTILVFPKTLMPSLDSSVDVQSEPWTFSPTLRSSMQNVIIFFRTFCGTPLPFLFCFWKDILTKMHVYRKVGFLFFPSIKCSFARKSSSKVLLSKLDYFFGQFVTKILVSSSVTLETWTVYHVCFDLGLLTQYLKYYLPLTL